MSRRDAVLRAAAGALQAESLDLTQFRKQGTRDERRIRVRGDTAAGALAFAALDQFEGQDGKPAAANDAATQRLPGEPLLPLLLRLKYADQRSKTLFQQAHLLLLRNYDLGNTKNSKALFSVAAVALFEWIHDRCPKCRVPKPRVQNPKPCPRCAPRQTGEGVDFGGRMPYRSESEPWRDPWGAVYLDRQGEPIMRARATTSPQAGCPDCKGTGRIFDKPKARSTGMRCVTCRNTGRVTFQLKQRWKLVNEYANGIGLSIGLEQFRAHWATRYHYFMDVLRSADQRIVADLALGIERSYKRAPFPIPAQHGADTETDEPARAEETPPDWPEHSTGELPPKDS